MSEFRNAYDRAEELLIDLPLGSIVKIPTALSTRNWFFQHQKSGIVEITPGAYVRALTESIRVKMIGLGYIPYHTGGGLMVWNRDIAPGRYFWICTEAQELYGDPSAKVWIAGSYANSGDDFIDCCGLTLDEAIAILPTLPIPGEEV